MALRPGDPPSGPRIPWPEEEPTVPLWPDAAQAVGIGRSMAYELAESGEFPCAVMRVAAKWVVPTAGLRAALPQDT